MRLTAACLALTALAAAACAGTPDAGSSASTRPEVIAVPGPGTAGVMTGPVMVANANASADDEDVVCKKLGPKTGSRVGGREVCLTQAKWDEQTKAAQGYTKDVQDSAKWNFDSGQ